MTQDQKTLDRMRYLEAALAGARAACHAALDFQERLGLEAAMLNSYGRIPDETPPTSELQNRMKELVYEVIKLDNLEKALTADPDDDLTSGPHKLRWLRMPEEEESAANPNKETEA